jgi:hypothetical protein
MEYALVKDGAILRRESFDGEAPQIAPNKGAWLPVVYVNDDTGPGQRIATEIVIEADQVSIVQTATDINLDELKADLQAQVRDLRWQHETGGITVGGVPIRTDEKSQAKIAGAVSLFDNDATLLSVAWEAQPGLFADLDEATVRAVGVAVGRHIQACFSRSKELCEAIAAADRDTLLALDITEGWPS